MSQITSKLLVLSSAALLASTMLAAGQGAPERKDKEGGAQQPGVTQSQPKGAAPGAQRGGQAQQSRPSTSGQAQTEEKKPTDEKGRVQEKTQNNKREGETRTQGQTQNEPQNKRDQERTQGQNTNPREQQKTPQTEQGQNQRGQEQNRTEGRTEQGNKANGGTSSVTLSSEQRTKVRQSVIDARGAPKVGRVDFSVTEGTVIPRSVHIVTVPEVLVEIHPEWRGFEYFVYNDEVIIVEPRTLKIVAIVPA